MALKNTCKSLRCFLECIQADLDKAEAGNKAAAQRVRTNTIKFEKMAKLYRKESVKTEKKGGVKKKKVAAKKAKKPAAKKAPAKRKAPVRKAAKTRRTASKATTRKRPTAKLLKKRPVRRKK